MRLKCGNLITWHPQISEQILEAVAPALLITGHLHAPCRCRPQKLTLQKLIFPRKLTLQKLTGQRLAGSARPPLLCGARLRRVALPLSGWLTMLKLTCWICGTNMSTLQRKRALAHYVGDQRPNTRPMPVKPLPPCRVAHSCVAYRGTSLIRKRLLLGPYSRGMHRVLGEARFLVGEVSLSLCRTWVDGLFSRWRGGCAVKIRQLWTEKEPGLATLAQID